MQCGSENVDKDRGNLLYEVAGKVKGNAWLPPHLPLLATYIR